MKRAVWVVTLFLVILIFFTPPAAAVIKSYRTILATATCAVASIPSPNAGDPSIILAGASNGIQRSLDGGATWTMVSTAVASSMAADPGNPAVVYAATSGGLLKSSDYGLNWGLVSFGIRYAVAVSPFDSQVLFVDNLKSVDGGATWHSMPGLPATPDQSLHIKCSRDPAYPGFMLAAMNEQSYKSDDGGESWVPFQYDVDSVEIDPVDARYFYLGGRCARAITRYYPGGHATSGPDHVHGMVVDPTDHSRIFAASDLGPTFTTVNYFQAAQSGMSVGAAPEGRMIIDASNGEVLIPTGTGLMAKRSWCVDGDADGYSPAGGLCGEVDCADSDAAFSPGIFENCLDGIDNNCNDLVDMADSRCISLCGDRDQDGHTAVGCPGGDDCHDGNPAIYPGAPELCDWSDNDCDGSVDEGFDQDFDGWKSCGGDCDDNDPAVRPDAAEICDGIDNNCDGVIDEWCPHAMLAWGANSSGQLGNGGTTGRTSPGTVPDFKSYLIGSGGNQTLAVAETTLWAWGENSRGQLGDGTTADRETPVPVLNVEGQPGYLQYVTSFSGGPYHTLVAGGGNVWAWGDNARGEVGDGTTVRRKQPVQIFFSSFVTAVAAGHFHSLALMFDGTVWAWGDNLEGQLGDGTRIRRTSPVQVPGLSGVVAIAAGADFSLAVTADGAVWAWGANARGQLGDGTFIRRKRPVRVKRLTGVTAVAGGNIHALARKSDGTVWAWGGNERGQLGDGTITLKKSPVRVKHLIGVTAIAAGGHHGLALDAGGIKAWGGNERGQLGDGTTTDRPTPVAVPRTAGVALIAAGEAHSLARR